MHVATLATIAPMFSADAHGNDRAPITGSGPLAARFNTEGHGLVSVSDFTFVRVERNEVMNISAAERGGDFAKAMIDVIMLMREITNRIGR